jgi:nitrate reductase NapE component
MGFTIFRCMKNSICSSNGCEPWDEDHQMYESWSKIKGSRYLAWTKGIFQACFLGKVRNNLYFFIAKQWQNYINYHKCHILIIILIFVGIDSSLGFIWWMVTCILGHGGPTKLYITFMLITPNQVCIHVYFHMLCILIALMSLQYSNFQSTSTRQVLKQHRA